MASRQALTGVPPAGQESASRFTVAHFLRQIQSAHARTRDHEPVPLHYDAKRSSLTQYIWPVHPTTRERLAPYEFESHRRTHELLNPCCLCAFLEGTEYTEAQVGIAETVTKDPTRSQSVLNGELVAVCAKQRCGYFLCLERFYTLRGLKSRICRERPIPLHPQDLAPRVTVDESFRAGDGLFQVMTDAVIRGRRARAFEVVKPRKEVKQAVIRDLSNGVTEERFWATFVQCLTCGVVTFRETFGANHACDIELTKRTRNRYTPYTISVPRSSSTRRSWSATRRRPGAIDAFPISSSSTATASEGGDIESGESQDAAHEVAHQSSDSDDAITDSDEDLPVLSSDFELPTLPQLLGLV